MDDFQSRCQITELVRFQAAQVAGLDPFYGSLLMALADDVEAGGETVRPLRPFADASTGDAIPLRLLGGAHRLALGGAAPDYAAHLLTCGGDGDAEGAWPALRSLCASGALDEEIRRPLQTNEPARAAALLPGLALVAEETGLPLRLLEIGASAGLLLRADRYRYAVGTDAWGDPSSPVVITASGGAPFGPVPVIERRGCDPNPLDPEQDRTLLLSFIWPSQQQRFRRLEATLSLAVDHPVEIDEATASTWLTDQLRHARHGVTTVIQHSIVWQYLSADEQRATTEVIRDAGTVATPSSPIAWLRFEPHRRFELGAELRLTLWPGGEDRSLALCGYHGDPVVWGPAPA